MENNVDSDQMASSEASSVFKNWMEGVCVSMILNLYTIHMFEITGGLSGRVIDLRSKGGWLNSPEPLPCVLEQDTPSSP